MGVICSRGLRILSVIDLPAVTKKKDSMTATITLSNEEASGTLYIHTITSINQSR